MRISILLLCIFTVISTYGQNEIVHFLENEGTITYVDDNKDSFYTVSFPGDSLEILDNESVVFMVDSSVIQIIKWPVEEEMAGYKYDSINESSMLNHFWENEFYYMQRHVYKRKLKCETEIFTNNYSKQFVLKYFRQNVDSIDSNFKRSTNDTTIEKVFPIEFQAYLLFTTNSYVTMINIPIYYEENISNKIEIIKSQIANSVRIYSWYIDFDILYNQIYYNLKGESFIINDTNHGIQFILPFWLNVGDYFDYYLVGTYPDINNISNASSMNFVPKSKFKSFKSFVDNSIKNEIIEDYSMIEKNENELLLYKVVQKNNGNSFYCQYGFMELNNYYVFVNFTATETTYNKNLERFYEFANSIRKL
jgi:sulfur relay (sulfurtransferase) DsrF/TusC family protein